MSKVINLALTNSKEAARKSLIGATNNPLGIRRMNGLRFHFMNFEPELGGNGVEMLLTTRMSLLQ